MNTLNLRAIGGLLFLVVVMGAALFIPAGTLDYWQAWVFLAVFGVSVLAITLYLMQRDPQLLQRRVNAGPGAEQQASQKLIQSLALGSWWGILMLAPITLVIVWRLLDEEKFLSANLAGYPEYCDKVRYHLIPFTW